MPPRLESLAVYRNFAKVGHFYRPLFAPFCNGHPGGPYHAPLESKAVARGKPAASISISINCPSYKSSLPRDTLASVRELYDTQKLATKKPAITSPPRPIEN
jgi:hypothetical protein